MNADVGALAARPCGLRRRVLLALALELALCLVGCAQHGAHAPVGIPAKSAATAHYVVQKGDTVFAIAFRLGCDFRTLARQNGIEAPFLIYPGRRLSAACASGADGRTVTQAGNAMSTAAANRAAAAVKPALGKPGPSTAVSPASDASAAVATPRAFVWPAAGRVLRGFGPGVGGVSNKGIDIGGITGDAVLAAADGEVVYAGDGLRGYGPLLILKHGDIYLTAYGHNDRLLVREGERVKARQKIAEIGSNGSDESSLHFEIRREGRPMDPQQLLPRR